MKKLWDRFSDIFGKTIIHPQFLLKRYENLAIETAKRYAKGTLVDIGCGRQPYKKNLVPYVEKYIGVDHPKVSQKYQTDEPPDILADATHIPLPDYTADITLMISLLEHLPKPLEALKEAARITRKEGILILITVQNYPMHDIPYDFFRYTRFSLKIMSQEAGFKPLRLIPLGNYPELLFQTFNVYLFYKIKEGLAHGGASKFTALLATPFIIIISIISNICALILGPLSGKNNGEFAIYNLLVAEKR